MKPGEDKSRLADQRLTALEQRLRNNTEGLGTLAHRADQVDVSLRTLDDLMKETKRIDFLVSRLESKVAQVQQDTKKKKKREYDLPKEEPKVDDNAEKEE